MRNLLESMPRRLEDVLSRKGNASKYETDKQYTQ
jgi:hypothetical protein